MQLVTLLIFAGICAAGPTRWHQLDDYNFDMYIEEFGRQYTDIEYQSRKLIFEQRLNKIRAHNKDTSKTWKEGVNKFTDRTEDELKRLLGYNKPLGYSQVYESEQRYKREPYKPVDIASLPMKVDWREVPGVLSAVKDQGECGSCWTFATASVIESQWAITYGQLPVLSEQQILDCTPNPNGCGGTGGCQGGTAELAMARIMTMGGLSQEWTYPYDSYFGANFACKFNSSMTKPFATLKGYTKLPSNQYLPLMQAVATIGPIAISVDASSWFAYEGGVFNGCNQTNPDIDHAVILAGYGVDSTLGPYWLVRNSWSPSYGEGGFIRLKRESTPTCGVDITPSDGTACKPYPSQVTVCGTCGILYDSSYPQV